MHKFLEGAYTPSIKPMTYIYKNKRTGKTIYSETELSENDYVLIGRIINGLKQDEVWTKTIQIRN